MIIMNESDSPVPLSKGNKSGSRSKSLRTVCQSTDCQMLPLGLGRFTFSHILVREVPSV